MDTENTCIWEGENPQEKWVKFRGEWETLHELCNGIGGIEGMECGKEGCEGIGCSEWGYDGKNLAGMDQLISGLAETPTIEQKWEDIDEIIVGDNTECEWEGI